MAKANDTACTRTNHQNQSTNSTPAPRLAQSPHGDFLDPMDSDTRMHKHPGVLIDTLLRMEDIDLLNVCQAHPGGVTGIRQALRQQKANGIEELVSVHCDNRGRSGACQGHVLPAAYDVSDDLREENQLVDSLNNECEIMTGEEPPRSAGEIYLTTIDGVLQWCCEEPSPDAQALVNRMNEQIPDSSPTVYEICREREDQGPGCD